MSDICHDRERGFEAKMELEQAQLFKIRSRRDRHFGEWAARRLGLSGDAAAAYVNDVIASNVEHDGYRAMFDKVTADLLRAGAPADAKCMQAELSAGEIIARREIAGS